MSTGRIFWEPHLPGSNPAERAAIYDAVNATIARLHSFDPAAIGLADYGRGENYVARQVERWSKQYRASETQTIDDMERLIAWLPNHLPPPGPVRLVHGDFRLDNTILAPDAPKVLAVLDWELSTLGDPLADFSYHLMKYHMPPTDSGGGTGSLVGHDLAGARHSVHGGTTSMPMRRAPALIRARISTPIWPTTSSASPRSCRASPDGCATAPRPANTPPPAP